MKVLEKGKGEWSREVKCTGSGNNDEGCEALLLIGAEDLYHTYHSDYGSGRETFVTFRCVECGAQTDVRDVPSRIPIRPTEKDSSGCDKS